MTSREQFEAWFATTFPEQYRADARRLLVQSRQGDGKYALLRAQDAWEGWQAARAQALEEAAQVCADWADSLNRDNHHMHTGSNGDLIEAADRCADAIRSMAKE